MTVYRQYDRAGLDAQYFLRGRVTDFQAYFDRYRARSDQAKATFASRLDVAFGESDAERLDLFMTKDHGVPVHVFIHGGYWQAMDKADFSFVAFGFVPQNVATVVINYALAPAADMDEILRQSRAALAWVWRNAARFGGDPNRIHVSGHSAGGHLTAMLALTDWPAFDKGLPRDLIKSGLAISGLFDLEPIRLCYLNDKLGLDAAAAERNSPQHLANAGTPIAPPPLVLAVGGKETDEFHRQQSAFAIAARAQDWPVQDHTIADHHHFSIMELLAEPHSALGALAHGLISVKA